MRIFQIVVSGVGFEPTLSQSKCDVLPLDDPENIIMAHSTGFEPVIEV